MNTRNRTVATIPTIARAGTLVPSSIKMFADHRPGFAASNLARLPVSVLVLVLLLLPVWRGWAAYEAFLRVDDIPGESQADGHVGEIDVFSFRQGTFKEDGSTRGVVDFSVIKSLDKASPLLVLHCANGRTIPRMTLTLRQSGGNRVEFYRVLLEEVFVTSVETSGEAQGPGSRPVEKVSFRFARITWTYTPILSNGNPGSPATARWDLMLGR